MTHRATVYMVSYVHDNFPLAACWSEKLAEYQIANFVEIRPETSYEDYRITPYPIQSFRTYIEEELARHGITLLDEGISAWANREPMPRTPGELLIQAYLGFPTIFDPMAEAIDLLKDPNNLKQLGIPMERNGEPWVEDRMEKLLEYFSHITSNSERT